MREAMHGARVLDQLVGDLGFFKFVLEGDDILGGNVGVVGTMQC